MSTQPPTVSVSTDEKATSASMVKLYECPVCFEHVTPPIHQCSNGHILCNGCLNRTPRLAVCPVCRIRITRNKIRNLQMERMAEIMELRFPCGNCDQECKLEELEDHKKACEPEIMEVVVNWREDQEMRDAVVDRIGVLLDRQGLRVRGRISVFEEMIFDRSSSRDDYDHRCRQLFTAIQNFTISDLLSMV